MCFTPLRHRPLFSLTFINGVQWTKKAANIESIPALLDNTTSHIRKWDNSTIPTVILAYNAAFGYCRNKIPTACPPFSKLSNWMKLNEGWNCKWETQYGISRPERDVGTSGLASTILELWQPVTFCRCQRVSVAKMLNHWTTKMVSGEDGWNLFLACLQLIDCCCWLWRQPFWIDSCRHIYSQTLGREAVG